MAVADDKSVQHRHTKKVGQLVQSLGEIDVILAGITDSGRVIMGANAGIGPVGDDVFSDLAGMDDGSGG